MKSPWIIALMLLAGPLPAEDFASLDGLSGIEVPAVSEPGSPKSINGAGARKSGGADMSNFFRKLESIGLDTVEIRAVTKLIDIKFREPSSDAAAEYGYILNNLYIPKEFQESGRNQVRFDLEYNLIDTLIHEYVHAARDVRASETSARGTPAREHYEAVAVIRADLRSQALFYRYSWMKADEVSSYFFGEAVSEVFETANDIVMYNTKLAGSKAASQAEAAELGGRLVLPKGPGGIFGLDKNKIFGRNSVYNDAQFKADGITGLQYVRWEERQFVKDDMYRNILGLKPPRDTAELLQRMNTLDNPWLRGLRAAVAKTRMDNAIKASSKP